MWGWNESILPSVISNQEMLKKEMVYLATFRTSSMKNHNWWVLRLEMRSTVVVQATKYSWKTYKNWCVFEEKTQIFWSKKNGDFVYYNFKNTFNLGDIK